MLHPYHLQCQLVFVSSWNSCVVIGEGGVSMSGIFTSYLLATLPTSICPLPSHILSISSKPISQACSECSMKIQKKCTVCIVCTVHCDNCPNSVIFPPYPSLAVNMTISQNRVGLCRIFGLFWQFCQNKCRNNFQYFVL